MTTEIISAGAFGCGNSARRLRRAGPRMTVVLVMLLTGALVQLADSEVVAGTRKAQSAVPAVEVASVAGREAHLACDITPQTRSEEAYMVFWYKSDHEGSPIYSVDGRKGALIEGRQWSNPSVLGERARVRMTPQRAELQIRELRTEDAGLYRCRIDFRNNPTKAQRFNLTVIVPPQSPIIYTGEHVLAKNLQAFNEGSELVLFCEVSGGWPPPRLTWHWQDRLVDESYTREYDVTVNPLNFGRVARNLLGAKFVCQASNTDLVAPTIAEIIVDVNLKPLVVNITNKAPYLVAMSTYEIECVSSGSRPEPVITWYKGSHQVKEMARNVIEGPNMTRSTLSYVPTIADDGKNLTCRAENPVIPSALEDKWQLEVHYIPQVSIKLGSSLRATDINEGDDVYFECDVTSNPTAYKLVWFKNGREIQKNASANVMLPGGNSLVLQSVTRASAGEYACQATNDEGKAISRPVTLDVMYAPVCKDGTTMQVVGALKQETISLVCGVQSKPPPTSFQWTFNNSGELMSVPATRYAQVRPQHLITSHWHGSMLNYTPANDMDYGTISCQAINKIGVQKVPCLFQLIAAGKPYPLQNCSAVQSTGPYAYRMTQEDIRATDARDADWLIVSCSEGFNGGLPIKSFELEVYSDESVYHVNTIYINHTDKASAAASTGAGGGVGVSIGAASGAGGPIFEVPGLEPGRNYRLLLYAVNAKGRSDPVVLEPVTLKGVAMYTTGRDSGGDSMDYSLLVAVFAGGITAVCILMVGITLTLYRRNHPPQPSKTQTHLVHVAGTPGSGGVGTHGTLAAVGTHVDHQQLQQQLQFSPRTVRQEYEVHQNWMSASKSPHSPFDTFARLSTASATTATTTTTTTTSPTTAGMSGTLASFGQQQLDAEDDPDVIASSKSERRPEVFEPNYASKPERIKYFRRHLEQDDRPWQNGDCQQVGPDDSRIQLVAQGGTRPSTLPVQQHKAPDVYTKSLRVQESCI
ncbi:hemicentin-1-like [Copidosoma floridanum]|uniref:hemicentin-1-like n=1 Tax=Copidosoma floridanum TaxID=29053 RepID=UPI0006C9A9FA|nr:hemicentin-1-like [Copidosoma floridanum]